MIEGHNDLFSGNPDKILWKNEKEEENQDNKEEEPEKSPQEIDEENLDVTITDSEEEALKN